MNLVRNAYHVAQRSQARDLVRTARTLAWETTALASHQKGLRQARRFRDASKLRINVGSGAAVRPGWVNIDLVPEADLTVDVRRGIPLPAGCASVIRSEHFLEHLDYPEDAMTFLTDCRRLLEPGGILSIAVPDAGMVLAEYAAGGGPLLSHAISEGWHPGSRTHMDQVNALFRQVGQHRYVYDAETLILTVEDAGFADVRQRDFDPSLDSENRRIGSLYVAAVSR